jgi:hypothetical protein
MVSFWRNIMRSLILLYQLQLHIVGQSVFPSWKKKIMGPSLSYSIPFGFEMRIWLRHEEAMGVIRNIWQQNIEGYPSFT